MVFISITSIIGKNVIEVICDNCSSVYQRSWQKVKDSRKSRKSTKDYCYACTHKLAAKSRPQCTKEFWDGNKRKEHSTKVKTDTYYAGVLNRGDCNNMRGKKHTLESKQKMSISRTGKIGVNATGWKGGKTSLTNRVKSGIQRQFNWFHCVMNRDGCRCQHCGDNKRLDAHHIIPIASIIVRLLKTNTFLTDDEKLIWLLQQPEIVDNELKNGITLCRACHKNVHIHWGSHNSKIIATCDRILWITTI